MTEIEPDGPLLHLLLGDSELELVPREHWSHPCVAANARKRGKRSSNVLLDSSIHHPLFGDPLEKRRRGRPDIVHQFLLMGLDSVLNIEGRLKLWVHTRNNDMIEVSEKTRLPKNYARYQGLFEELLMSGRVPGGGDPLMAVQKEVSLMEAVGKVKEFSGGRGKALFRIMMSDKGTIDDPLKVFGELLKNNADTDILCIIGGFSVGDMISRVEVDRTLSIHAELLKVWTVETELLSSFRRASTQRKPCF